MNSTLTLEQAQTMIERALAHADEIGIEIAVAVVDPGGHVVASARMDAAPFGTMSIAVDKGFTAVSLAEPTGLWQPSTQPGGDNWGMHVSMAGRLTVYPGGEPVVRDGRVVGGVGVSGGAGAQDKACAEYAISA